MHEKPCIRVMLHVMNQCVFLKQLLCRWIADHLRFLTYCRRLLPWVGIPAQIRDMRKQLTGLTGRNGSTSYDTLDPLVSTLLYYATISGTSRHSILESAPCQPYVGLVCVGTVTSA